MKNAKARLMHPVIAWAHIKEFDLDPFIPALLSDTKKLKHRLNIFNTIDDTIINYTVFEALNYRVKMYGYMS